MPLAYEILRTLKLLLQEHDLSIVVANSSAACNGDNYQILVLSSLLTVRMV
ncbi:hypothetical protein [Nostoc sp. CMAA1605]|uniref:hypothetical protein n=1 Tax=Nostoc sp. CMAA1605 TaxID=2055159 RepID=UPI001F445EE8|nr:hypothetical protein [Nostoc sp. CMAA1605]